MSYTILLGFAVALSVFFFWVGRRAARTTVGAGDQLGRYLEDNPTSILQNSPMVHAAEPGFAERILAPALRSFLNRLGSLTPNRNVETLTRRLDMAGRPFGLTVLNFLGLKFIAALLLAMAGFALFVLVLHQAPTMGVIFLIIFGILGFYLPELWLSSAVRSRQHEIVRALPDALDMIVVCTEAGQSFDQALRRWATNGAMP
jgi:tight adherence protein C